MTHSDDIRWRAIVLPVYEGWPKALVDQEGCRGAGTVAEYRSQLEKRYQFPAQLLFVDETGKDSRAAFRHHSYSPVAKCAVVRLPFRRGERVSALAAFGYQGMGERNLT